MDKAEKEKDLWGMLWFDVFIALACLMVIAFNWSVIHSVPLKILAGILPTLLIIFHAAWTLGLRRGLAFLCWIALGGFVFEWIGLRTGIIFGHYAYKMDTPAFGGVPLLVILYWPVFVYIGYAITTSFLYWSGRGKPGIYNRNRLALAGLILMDGCVVTAIDLFMDPLQVRLGSWAWQNSGPYFGVPLQNFLGWFAVTIIATGLFRIFEYYFPRRLAAISKTVFIIPLVAYIWLVFGFVVLALIFHMPSLAVAGSMIMLAVAIVNLTWYERRLLQRHHRQPLPAMETSSVN
jgi:uncharacterized membrane protein